MIIYAKKFLGLNLLIRAHGSAIYKSAVPGLISIGMYFLLLYTVHHRSISKSLNHPYAIGVLFSSISFLIIFRANHGYQRHWEACADVFQMMSKWLDAVTHTAVYHMQQSHYNHIKPPSYYDNHDLNKFGLTRDRERIPKASSQSDAKTIRHRRQISRSIEFVDDKDKKSPANVNMMDLDLANIFNPSFCSHTGPAQLKGPARRDGGWGDLFDDGKSTYYKIPDKDKDDEGSVDSGDSFWDSHNRSPDFEGFASTRGGRTPVLFLQELAHLASLCNAVAFCTLRNDVEGSESPLDMYHPGSPWPECDPDKLPRETRRDFNDFSRFKTLVQYFLGFDRTPEARTRYNASRPLPVLGGVSDHEIAFLQKAKGSMAKVQLAWSWLSEFIIREHLAGSLGAVAPPIISRIIQFLSDGMTGYNQARKVMLVPFPFPHAQLSAFYVVAIIFVVPFLMTEYTNTVWLGALLTFLTVTCLSGLHDVARELENPFRNVPNDIPLCTLQAMFNEALITMYAGYHPDQFWDGDAYRAEAMSSQNGIVPPIPTPKRRRAPKNSTVQMVPLQQSSENPKEDTPKSLDMNKTLVDLQELVSKHAKEIERLTSILNKKAEENMDVIS